MKLQISLNFRISVIHFKVCLQHGLKISLCLWGSEEGEQMPPPKGSLPSLFCLWEEVSYGSQQFEWVEYSTGSSHYKLYCVWKKLPPPPHPTDHGTAEPLY